MNTFTKEAWIILRLLRLVARAAQRGTPSCNLMLKSDFSKATEYLGGSYGWDQFFANKDALDKEAE